MIHPRATLPLVLIAALSAGCERGTDETEPPPYEPPDATSFAYATGTARITTATDTQRVRVEIAERDDQRAFGLMERTSLDEDAGMIFLYDTVQGPTSGFWMYRTRIPLDIAYFDTSGRIVAILQMEPCPSPEPSRCRSYIPGASYAGALEVNHGWFARHGVKVGDHIELERQ